MKILSNKRKDSLSNQPKCDKDIEAMAFGFMFVFQQKNSNLETPYDINKLTTHHNLDNKNNCIHLSICQFVALMSSM